MFGSQFHGSDYYASLYYAVLRGDDGDASAAFARLSLRDVQYEALLLVIGGKDARSMEWEHWYATLGGNANWSTRDIMYEGILKGLGFSAFKDYYDSVTANVWPDHNSSEKAYWLKLIADNV